MKDCNLVSTQGVDLFITKIFVSAWGTYSIILVLTYNNQFILAGLLCIPTLLLARYLSLMIPIKLFAKKLDFVPNTNLIMTWGGLRGGISIALALSLTQDMHRDLFLVVTYIIVVFSIIGQGLTVGKLIKKLSKE